MGKNELFRTDAAYVFTHPRPQAEAHDRPLSEARLTPIRIRTRDTWPRRRNSLNKRRAWRSLHEQ